MIFKCPTHLLWNKVSTKEIEIFLKHFSYQIGKEQSVKIGLNGYKNAI